MSFQTVFQRYELKYLLTQEQKKKILQAMAPYMELDQYGRTTIRNLYFDTGNYRLARHSIEKPSYKEKLRVRSYSQADPESPVFVELKKKYRNVVYKRRIALPEKEAMGWLQGGRCSQDIQISREVDYFLSYYRNLAPVVFLSYEREAFFSEERPDFRVTFDERILCRQEELSLEAEVYGTELLPEAWIPAALRAEETRWFPAAAEAWDRELRPRPTEALRFPAGICISMRPAMELTQMER